MCSGDVDLFKCLADAFEATIGAVYLDQGMAACRDFVFRVLFCRIDEVTRRVFYDFAC